MLPQASENCRIQIVETGVDQFRNALPSVLRHFDPSSIDSIADSIADSNITLGMRFAAAQAFLIRSTDSAPGQKNSSEDAKQELASAYLLEYPGKLASLVGPWVESGRLARDSSAAATEVLTLLIDRARFWGVELVQAVIDDDSPFPTDALDNAGLARLSTLHQMAIDLPARNASLPKTSKSIARANDPIWSAEFPFQWKRYSSVDEAVWIDWMDATYEQTADCPELNGLRTTAKTLEGYLASSGTKNTRLKSPEWWGAFDSKGNFTEQGGPNKIASAFMLSDSGGGFWELSYMGVAPPFRGRGLGNETLCRALLQAQELSAKRLTLAVDCRNSFAIRLYRERGFQRIRQLEAWFLAIRR